VAIAERSSALAVAFTGDEGDDEDDVVVELPPKSATAAPAKAPATTIDATTIKAVRLRRLLLVGSEASSWFVFPPSRPVASVTGGSLPAVEYGNGGGPTGAPKLEGGGQGGGGKGGGYPGGVGGG